MELIDKRISHKSKSDVFTIYMLADVHLGNKGCDKSKLMEDINKIKNDPFSLVVLGGDYIDAVGHTDKRFDIQSLDEKYHNKLDNLADAEMDDFIKLMMPIKDKVLGVLTGNHEETIRKKLNRDITSKLANALQVPELKNVAFIRVTFTRYKDAYTFILFVAHGRVAGRSSGSKVNMLEKIMGMFDADIYMIAHGHKKTPHTSTSLKMPKRGDKMIVVKKKVGFMTGAYLRTYEVGSTSYGEPTLYAPSDLGMLGVKIKPTTKEVGI